MSEIVRTDRPETPPYPTDSVLFMEFPMEWNDDSSEARSQAMINMLESPVVFNGPILREFLLEHQISLSVSIPADADPQSLVIMKYLSDYGLPFCAWVGIQDRNGYFLNHQTAPKYMRRALAIAEWADENEIRLGGIGLDIEPPIDAMSQFSTGKLGAFALSLINYRRWLLKQEQRDGALSRINDGIAELREDHGLFVETYVAPPLLHRFLGLPTPTSPNARVEMLYSSLYGMKNLLFGRLWNVEDDLALGIVNGVPGETPGRDFGGDLQRMNRVRRETQLRKMHLTQTQLVEDLRIANAISLRKLGHPISRFYAFALNAPIVAVRVNLAREEAGI